ncbi:C-type lectin-like [Heptranchias perlo]|uniref:C-type lectin-like n=1 Tax=Heptranchias perlo TaxID=212740 RepID=UPI003559BA3B
MMVMVVRDQSSQPQDITAGVPQGSIIGPTIFISFISDLLSTIRQSHECTTVGSWADVSLNGTSENQQQEAETDQDQDLDQRDVPERGSCPNGWFYFNYFSSCYRFVPDTQTWIEAELSCQQLATGGHLASIHWKEQNHFIELLLKAEQSNNHVWIGLSDRHKEGTFLWTDGSLSDFTNWHLGEPDNYKGRENCVVINSEKWNDVPCTGKSPFICSYKPHDW